MKLYVFTKKDIDRFLIECNFTPDEEKTVPAEMQRIYARILRRTDEREHIHGEAIKPPGKQ